MHKRELAREQTTAAHYQYEPFTTLAFVALLELASVVNEPPDASEDGHKSA